MVSEDGLIKRSQPTDDLLLQPQLDRWAEAQPNGSSWQLSRASVTQALRNGATINQLIGLLQARLTRGALPPLLGVALRAWGGAARRRAGGHRRAALHRPGGVRRDRRQRPAEALLPAAELAPDLLLVEPRQVPALRERLAWAGLDIGTTIEVIDH